jgi:hypothetical protein
LANDSLYDILYGKSLYPAFPVRITKRTVLSSSDLDNDVSERGAGRYKTKAYFFSQKLLTETAKFLFSKPDAED